MLTGLLSALLVTCTMLPLLNMALLVDGPQLTTRTTKARLKAIVDEPSQQIDVSIAYELHKTPGLTHISLTGIKAFNTQIQDINAFFDSDKVKVHSQVDPLVVKGKFELPPALAQDSIVSFVLSYTLLQALKQEGQEVDIQIPLLWIKNSYLDSKKTLFNAHLVVPEAHYINESFPGTSRPCYSNSDTRHYCVNLQALPTFIRFRGTIGQYPPFSAIKALDYGIIVMLISTCVFFGLLLIRKQRKPVVFTS